MNTTSNTTPTPIESAVGYWILRRTWSKLLNAKPSCEADSEAISNAMSLIDNAVQQVIWTPLANQMALNVAIAIHAYDTFKDIPQKGGA